MNDIDEQINLIIDVMPSFLQKYGCKVKITKTDKKTVALITANDRKFKLTFKEIFEVEKNET